MAKRNKKNRMSIEALEPRLLLAGDPSWLNNAVDTYASPIVDLELTGDRNVASQTGNDCLHRILTVEMNDANGTAGVAAAGWDLISVNTLNITAKPTGSFTVDDNGTENNKNDDTINENASGRYVVRLKSINTLTTTAVGDTPAKFNPLQSYRWKILQANNIITDGQFDPSAFAVDTADFLIDGVYSNRKTVGDIAAADNGGLSILYGGKFLVELEENALYLNYISPIQDTVHSAVTASAQKNELLWNINDVAGGYSIIPNTSFPAEVNTEHYGNDVYESINLSAVTAENPFTIRVRTLASTNNALSLFGAGSFGAIHNFDFSKEYTWKIANATDVAGAGDLQKTTAIQTLMQQNALKLDPSLFTGGNLDDLTLAVEQDALVLKYTPQYVVTSPLTYPAASNINLATQTGDVLELEMSRFFAADATNFEFVNDGGDMITDENAGVANEFKIIRDQKTANTSDDVIYFVPYITEKIATSLQQQTDRGFYGLTHFHVRASVGANTETKTFTVRVDPGYGRLHLKSSVGNGATNDKGDIIRVQQRLKFFGMPVNRLINGVPQTFAEINGSAIEKIRHTLTDYRSIRVDGVNPGAYPQAGDVNSAFYQALSTFSSMVRGIPDSIVDDGGLDKTDDTYDDYPAFSGTYRAQLQVSNLPGVDKSIDPNSCNDKVYQWLSSSNAPFWMEIVDTTVNIADVQRGGFSYSPLGKDYTGDANAVTRQQSERYGTGWAANVLYYVSNELDGKLISSGVSLINGGDSVFHSNHESGISIDLTVSASTNAERTRLLNALGGYTDALGHKPINASYITPDSIYDNITVFKDGETHFHSDITIPLLKEMFFRLENGVFYDLKNLHSLKMQMSNKVSADTVIRGADTYGLYSVNGIVLTQEQKDTLNTDKAVTITDEVTETDVCTINIISQDDLRTNGRFYLTEVNDGLDSIDIAFEVVDNDPYLAADNVSAKNLKYLTTVSLEKNINAPYFIEEASAGIGVAGDNVANDATDIILTKARLNYLGYKDNANNALNLTSGNDPSFIEAIQRFQCAVRSNFKSDAWVPDGKIEKEGQNWKTGGLMLWNVNAPRVISDETGVTINYVKAFVDSVGTSSGGVNWTVNNFSSLAALPDTTQCNKAFNARRAFEVTAGAGLGTAITQYVTKAEADGSVAIRKFYVNTNENISALSQAIQNKIEKCDDVATIGDFVVELYIENLSLAPTYEMSRAVDMLFEGIGNELHAFSNVLPATGVLAQLGGNVRNWFDTYLQYEEPVTASLAAGGAGGLAKYSVAPQLMSDITKRQFAVGDVFDFGQAVSGYLGDLGDYFDATYQGISSAIYDRLNSILSFIESKSIGVDVKFDETTDEIVLNLSIDASKSISDGFDFGNLSQMFKGSKLPIEIELNFVADVSLVLDVSKILNESASSLSMEDASIRVNRLGVSASASYGTDGNQNTPDSETQKGGLSIGSINLDSTLKSLSLDIGTGWTVRNDDGDTSVSFQDLIDKKYNWYNDSTAAFSSSLELTATGNNVSGSATLTLEDEDLFESGNTTVKIGGTVVVGGISIGDNLLNLGKTTLTFNSAAKTVQVDTESASMHIGNDILAIEVQDSTDPDDTDNFAVTGSYNYETGAFGLTFDKWSIDIKGLLSANGTGCGFNWNEKSQDIGQEIFFIREIEKATILPLNKELKFDGVGSGDAKRVLSVYDNGFKLYGVEIPLSDSGEVLTVGNDLLTIQNPTITLDTIEYFKGGSGLSGTIGLKAANASADMNGVVSLTISDSDSDGEAISGSYNLSTKKFNLTADTTVLDIASGKITATIEDLKVCYEFGGNGSDANAEVLAFGGDIEINIDGIDEPITIAAQDMLVNNEHVQRSLSVTGNSFRIGNASYEFVEGDKAFGALTLTDPKVVLQDFGYNKETEEFSGKIGFAAEAARIDFGGNIDLAISRKNGDAVEILYDLNNGGFTGTIDRVDFTVKNDSDEVVFLAYTSDVKFTTDGSNTCVEMYDVNAVFPTISVPMITIAKVKIESGKDVVVTYQGEDFSLPEQLAALTTKILKTIGFTTGDDDVVLTQDAGTKKLELRDRTSNTLIDDWELSEISSETGLKIDLDSNKGVDRILINSDIDMGGKDLTIISDYITVSNKTITNVDDLKLDAGADLDVSALDMIGLLLEAFNFDLENSSDPININYDTLINRLLGRAEAVVAVTGSEISARNVSFTATVNVFGERTGLFPVSFEGRDDDAKRFKIPGLTTALASVQAKALVNILNSVIESDGKGDGDGLTITSDANVKIKNTAKAQPQEEGEENDDEDVEYDAVVALAIVNSKSIASVGGTSELKIDGKITINASNRTAVENKADGLPEDASKAYGGSFGILVVNKETEASIGSDVTITTNTPESIVVDALSVTHLTNEVTATAGGANDNNDNNSDTMNSNGGKNGSGEDVKVAGAAAITIVNDRVDAIVNFKNVQTTNGTLSVKAENESTIKTTADGRQVDTSGSDDEDAPKVGVGVAVALNVINIDANAIASNVAANGISISAITNSDTTAEARAGAGAKNVGIAGSVAVNTIDQTTIAQGENSLNLRTGGKLAIIADSTIIKADSKALPKEDVDAEKVGIGASFALNDVDADTLATDKGATITGTVTGMKIEATTEITTAAETKAGSTASDGAAVSPSVAVNVIKADTSADHSATSTSSVSGDIEITSNSKVGATTKAGSSADGNVAIGASIGIAVIKSNSNAEVSSGLVTTAGSISVNAGNTISSTIDVEASPRLSSDANQGKKSDDESNEQLKTSRLSESDKNSANADSTVSKQNTSSQKEGGSSSNSVGVSAAIGVNVLMAKTDAEVSNGADLTASGNIEVAAKEDIDAVTQAIAVAGTIPSEEGGSDEESADVLVGAGVGLNVINKSNTAKVAGGSVLTGNNVTVKAESENENTSSILAGSAAMGSESNTFAVNAGINVINTETLALVDAQSEVVSGGNTELSAKNVTDIQTLAMAAGISSDNVGVGASIVVNVANTNVNAIDKGEIDADGNVDIAAVNNIQTAKHVFTVMGEKVTVPENVTAVAFAGGVTANGDAGVAGSFIINSYSQETIASIDKGAVVLSGGNVDVEAHAATHISNVAGTIAGSGGSAAVGAGCDVTVLNKTTSAIITNDSIEEDDDVYNVEAGGKLTILADSTETMTSVVAGLSGGSDVAVGISASILVVKSITEAEVQNTVQSADGEVLKISTGDMDVVASDDAEITQVVAGVCASGTVAVGGAAVIAVHDDQVTARVGDNSIVESSGSVKVNAESNEKIVQVGALGGVSGGVAVNGMAVVVKLNEITNASVGKKSDIVASNSIDVKAKDTTGHISVLGIISGGSNAGVGVGGTVVTMHKETGASIEEGANLTSTGSDITISADSIEREISVTAGVAVGTVGVGLNASVHVAEIITTANIGDDATVYAFGTVTVSAHDDFDIDKVTAGISAGTAGIGLAAGVTILDQNTSATVGNASVTGLGKTSGVNADYGRFGVLNPGISSQNGAKNDKIEPLSVDEYKEDDGNGLYDRLLPAASLDPVSFEKDPDSDIKDEDQKDFVEIGGVDNTGGNVKGVAVTASNNTDFTGVTAGIGAGTVGISLNAGVTIISENATAEIGSGAEINTIEPGEASNDQQVVIGSGNNLNYTAVTASIAAGAVAVAPAANVAVVHMGTDTNIRSGATVNAKGDVTIASKANERLLGIAIGGAGGVVGIGGSVQVINITNDTATLIESGVTISSGGKLTISANDNTKAVPLSGGIAGGLVGIGATVGVLNIAKNTTVTIQGGIADADDANEDDTEITANKVVVKAANNDELFQLAAAGGMGYVGVGGAVSIILYESNANITIGTEASPEVTIDSNSTIEILADNDLNVKPFTLGVGAGLVGVGGAVTIGKVTTGTGVNISGNLVAGDTIKIDADSYTNLKSWAIAGTAGAVAVNAAVSSWTIGGGTSTNVQHDGEPEMDALDDNGKDHPDDQAKQNSVLATSQTSTLLSQRQNSSTNIAPKSSSGTFSDSTDNTSMRVRMSNSVPDTTKTDPSGTEVIITNSADITATHNISIAANGKVEVVQETPSIAAGAIAVGGSVNILKIDTHVNTTVGGTLVSEEGDITVHSGLTEDVSMQSIGAQGGLVAVGAAVIVANDTSSVSTTIAPTGSFSRPSDISGNNVYISSSRNINKFDGKIIKATGGLVAVGASVIYTNIDGSGAQTSVGEGAQLEATGNLAITARAEDTVYNSIIPVSIGGGVFNGVVSKISVNNSSSVLVDDSTGLTADNVLVYAYGNHANRARIDSLSIGGINAGIFLSTVTNTSDATVTVNAATITGAIVHIETSNDFDRLAFNKPMGSNYSSITGDSYSFVAGVDAHKSVVSIGTASDSFDSSILIDGNAIITADSEKSITGTGIPKISILAQTNAYVFEKSEVSTTSVFGNYAKVQSIVNINSNSNITIQSGAEITNTEGQISVATLSNATVFNVANASASSLLVSVTGAEATTNVQMDNNVLLDDVNMEAKEIYIASGRVLGNKLGLKESGDANWVLLLAFSKGTAISGVGAPDAEAKNNATIDNSIIVTGDTIVKSYGNVTIETRGGNNLVQGDFDDDVGSFLGIPIIDILGDDSLTAIDSNSEITVGEDVDVSAGMSTNQTVLLLNSRTAESIGLDTFLSGLDEGDEYLFFDPDHVAATDSAMIDAINGLGKGTIDTSIPYVATKLSCNVEIPVYKGTKVSMGETLYKYEGIDLTNQFYDDRPDLWYKLPSDFVPTTFFYDSDPLIDEVGDGEVEFNLALGETVAINYGEIVKHDGNYYRYNKKRDLTNITTYSEEGWSTTEDDSGEIIEYDLATQIRETLAENIILIKPVDIETPRLSYENYRNMLEQRKQELFGWGNEHFDNPAAKARYEATIQMLDQQIAELTTYQTPIYDGDGNITGYHTIPVTHALLASFGEINGSKGSIVVDLDVEDDNDASVREAVEDGRLHAGDGASVTIHNTTPVSMVVNNITMKTNADLHYDSDNNIDTLFGGRVYLNSTPIDVDTGATQEYVTITQDTIRDEDTLKFGESSQLLVTDIFVNGTILNENGTVEITNRAGAINISGEIIALNQEISAKTSVNVNTPGLYTVGAHPQLLTLTETPEYNLLEMLRDPDISHKDIFQSQNNVNTDDVNEGERFLRRGGFVRALGNITIIAGSINVNGTIESGISSLDLLVEKNESGNITVLTTINDTLLHGSSMLVQYTVDNVNKNINIEDIVTRGGNIILCGDIFNTNPDGGNIKVTHGYANIDIQNETDYTLILNKIDTSRKNEGSVTIYDTKQVLNEASELGSKVIYKYDMDSDTLNVDRYNVIIDDGLYTYELDSQEEITNLSLRPDYEQPEYNPVEGMFAIWVEGQSTKSQIEDIYISRAFNLTPGWTSLGDRINDALGPDYTHLSHTVTPTSTLQIVKSFGLYLPKSEDVDTTDWTTLVSNGVIVPGTGDEPNQYMNDYFGTYEEIPEGEAETQVISEHSGGGWRHPESWTVTQRTSQGHNNYYTHYLYASHNIGVDFLGGTDNSSIIVNSIGDVVLQGNINAPTGSTMQVTSDGKVRVADGIIFNNGLTPDIESYVNGQKVMTVNITDTPFNLTVSGDITIRAVSADGSTAPLIIGNVESTNGTVTILSETGVVAADAYSLISGKKVFIKAENGTIGEETLALKINSNTSDDDEGGVAAFASGGIYLTESEGDMRLISQPEDWEASEASVHSQNGDVYLTSVSGNIINGRESGSSVPNVQGSNIVVTTGGSNEVQNLVVGDHESLFVNSSSNVSLVATGDMNIGAITSGDSVTLNTGGNLVDVGTETSAVVAVNGLTINSNRGVLGRGENGAFNVQLGTAAELNITSVLDSWVNQVAEDGLVGETTVTTDGMSVNSAHSDGNIRLTTEEGDLRITRVTAGKNITLTADGSIVDSTTDDSAANVDTTGAASGFGRIYLTAGEDIGEADNFFDVKAAGKLTSSSDGNTFVKCSDTLKIENSESVNGDIVLRAAGNCVISGIVADNGTVAIDADGSILNGRNDSVDLIHATTIVLNAENGTIGESTKAFVVDSSAGTVTAEAAKQVYMAEGQGLMNVNSITSESSEVVLSSKDGFVDANSSFTLGLDSFDLGDLRMDTPLTDLNIAATTIRIISSEGGIGTLANAIEIDVYGERTGRLFADAKNDISIDEIVGSMNAGIIVSHDRTIALGTPDSADAGEDIFLDGNSEVKALKGSIHIKAGDDLYHLSGAMVIAGETIYLYGDYGNADTDTGSAITIKGTISATLTQIEGNSDNDTILIDVRDSNTVKGRVEVYGGEGDDSITSLKLDTDQVHLFGGEDNDTINAGTMANRVHIYGGAGNDTITGGTAGDIIFGGSGDDAITAGKGNDLVFGDGGSLINNQTVVAHSTFGSGKDDIDGGEGSDVLIGDNGVIAASQLYSRENRIEALVTIDTTESSQGDDDDVNGAVGDDVVLGGAGSDGVEGGTGDDMIFGDNGTVSFTTDVGGIPIRTFNAVDLNGDGNDSINGSSGNDTILGGAGADTINGGDGNDAIFGDSGSITVEKIMGNNFTRSFSSADKANGAADTITGGNGDDLVSGGVGNDVIEGNDGNDIILGDTGTVSYVTVSGINYLNNISSVDQTVSGNDTITGGSGEDRIFGGAGSDVIDGGDNSDIIFGDTGSITYQTVNGVNYRKTISNAGQSVSGDDTIKGGTGEEIVLAGNGNDNVDTGVDNGSDIILGDTGKIDYEIVSGTAAVKTITTIGEPAGGNDTIYTGAGTDVVIGGGGNDSINAGDGTYSIIVGDNGIIAYDNPDASNHYINNVTAADTGVTGIDIITTGATADIVLGGMGADAITVRTGEDIVIGDNGTVQFSNGVLDIIYTSNDAFGDNDTIVGQNDTKIILGGFGDDTITVQNGNDIILGDGGYVDFINGLLVEANANGIKYGGNDTVDAGSGMNTVIGGLGDDRITTGIDRQCSSTDIREKYVNDNDVVIGDNGRRTFNSTGLQVDNRDTAIMSFNFQGGASKGIGSTQKAGAPDYKVSNWINLQGSGPSSYGNDPTEIITLDNGQRLDGLTLSWGGKERHRTDSIQLNSYQMESYNPDTIQDPATGLLSPGDGYLFAGGVRTSAPNTQCNSKLEVEMDGLNKYFKEYSVIVYLDAPSNVSSLIQNPSDSPIGKIYGKGESIRQVNLVSASKNDSFFLDDAADANNPAYNTFNGNYIKSTWKDANSAFGKYANYVVFDGCTDDRFVVTVTDGVININYNGRDIPSIAGIQIVGKFNPVDTIASSPTEAGGNDIISTGGGDDIVIGGAGSDSIATFGDIRDGIDDADTVIGDNGSVTLMNRTGWNYQDSNAQLMSQMRNGEVINAKSTGFDSSVDLNGATFNDTIFTGNGNDVVIGGDGQDKINTQRHDDIASNVWGADESNAPEAMKSSVLSALQNFETNEIKVLSVNFSTANDSNPDFKVPEDQYAGVVAAKNWNNLLFRSELNPVQYPNPYNNASFKTNDGTTLTGLNFNIAATENGNKTQLQFDSDGHNQIHPDSDNAKLFESYFWAQKQQQIEININNIGNQTGFSIYDVYVYLDGENERTDDDNYIFEVKGGDLANSATMKSYYVNDWRGNSFNGEFKEVTATSYTIINNGVVPNMELIGNYVVFRNVTAQNFAIRIKNVKVGDQSPLNMPCVSGIQIVAGSGRTKVAANDSTGSNVPCNGDYDKDVAIGDNGMINATLDIPYGIKDNVAIAQNKVYEAISNPQVFNGGNATSQNDFIVTGRNQDINIGGNGSDMIDSGAGDDVVIGDNAQIEMTDYNPIGVRLPLNLKILDSSSTDNGDYVGKPWMSADQFRNKITSGNVPGVKEMASTLGGYDVIDGGDDNDLIYGQEGNDVLIGGEGDDVLFDPTGTNKFKDTTYATKAAFEADMADVYTTLDANAVLALKEFVANNYDKTSTKGIISTR
jgi:hypothetical protein